MGYFSLNINFRSSRRTKSYLRDRLPRLDAARSKRAREFYQSTAEDCAGCLQDGYVDRHRIQMVVGRQRQATWGAYADLLVSAGLWVVVDANTWRIVDFEKHNFSRASHAANEARRNHPQPDYYDPIGVSGEGQGCVKPDMRLCLKVTASACQSQNDPRRRKVLEKEKSDAQRAQTGVQRPPPLPRRVVNEAADVFEKGLGRPAEGREWHDDAWREETDAACAFEARLQLARERRLDGPDEGVTPAVQPIAPTQRLPAATGILRKPPTPRNALPKPRPRSVPSSQRRPDKGALNLHLVEQGLVAMGLDAQDGLQNQAPALFARLVSLGVDASEWGYGQHAVARARSAGRMVRNPFAYAWAAIRTQRVEAGQPEVRSPP